MKIENIIFYIILASAIPIVANILAPGIVGVPTFISNIIIIIILYQLYSSSQYEILIGKKYIYIWVGILFIGGIRAFFQNISSFEGIRDAILSIVGISSVFCIYLGGIKNIPIYLKSFLIIMGGCSIFSALEWNSYGLTDVAHILYPISFFLFLYPYVSRKMRILLIVVALFSFFYDVSIRSNVLLLSFTFFLLFIFYVSRHRRFLMFRKLIWVTCIVLPFVLLFLGILGRYNIFRELMSSDVKIELSGSKGRSNYMTDSRTSVYEDVLTSIDNASALIFGKSPVAKINTHMAQISSSYKNGRSSTESGFLNILYFYGLIGVSGFLALTVYSSYMGVYRSYNKLAIMTGLYVVFKFMFIFIEEPRISMITYFAIGLCMNPEFREMSDSEIKETLNI